MTKRKMVRAIKDNAAGLLEAFDLEQLLGSDIYAGMIEDGPMQAFARAQQVKLAERIRNL